MRSTTASVRGWAGGTLCVVAALLLASAPAAADTTIGGVGSAAGQYRQANGAAVDRSDGRVYVLDGRDSRVDAFEADGSFAFAFGWGVADGKSRKFQVCSAQCFPGISGAGPGQLGITPYSSYAEITVDNDPTSPSYRDVYVAEPENSRIQQFSSTGAFVLTFGGGVDQTTGGNLCTAASGDACGAGSSGAGPGEFAFLTAVAVGPGGTVHAADGEVERVTNPEGEHEQIGQARIERFDAAGAYVDEFALPQQDSRTDSVAVSSDGTIYTASEGLKAGLRKYDQSGKFLGALTPIPTNNIDNLGIDAAGDLYATETVSPVGVAGREFPNLVEYDSGGAVIDRYGFGDLTTKVTGVEPRGPAGDVIIAEEEVLGAVGEAVPPANVRILPAPPAGPIIVPEAPSAESVLASSATVMGTVSPHGEATTYHFEYVDDESFRTEGGFASPGTQESAESEPIGSDFRIYGEAARLESLVPETKYHYRMVASNAGGVRTGPEGTLTTVAPLILGRTFATQVGLTGATLNAEVNPVGVPASGYFEYVTEAAFDASGFLGAATVPATASGAPPIDFGAGIELTTGSARLEGLTPNTTYHYRLVAKDEFKTVVGDEFTFRTYSSAAADFGLPDGRAFELVSPTDKGSAEVAIPAPAGGAVNRIEDVIPQQAAPSGEAVTYASFTAFGDATSAPSASQYVSRRTASGWTTENISPAAQARILHDPFRGFSPDLSQGAVLVQDPLTRRSIRGGFENLYLRDAGGGLQTVTTRKPRGVSRAGFFCLSYAGASADSSRVIFSANGAITSDAPEGESLNLYEWTAAGGVRLVSVLPSGQPAPPSTEGVGFGAAVANDCDVGAAVLRHAISADGSRIFWTYGGRFRSASRPLLARLGGSETIELDAKQGGPGPSGEGRFRAADADGSRVFFTDRNQLTADSTAQGSAEREDLYLYDFDAPEGERLTDLTVDSTDQRGAQVEGVVGADEAGSYLYFVARGDLTPGEANQRGEVAESGGDNLYVWHTGAGIEFIATLTEADRGAWSDHPVGEYIGNEAQFARVTPDGRHLAFLSALSLTGFDNTIADGSGVCTETPSRATLSGCTEAYLYDAESGALACASCNPSGARPIGPFPANRENRFAPWSTPFEGPRYLSDDGDRLFFESFDALSPLDTNGKRDVYEFERLGVGSCSAESTGFSPAAAGCVALISGGVSGDESYFLDASAEGRDVFISTRLPLVSSDEGERYDVYDAREGGGFPQPSSPPAACTGEACRGSAQSPPSSPSPGTPSFVGPGNQRPGRHRCAKGKVKRAGKCVKAKKGRHRHGRRGSKHHRGKGPHGKQRKGAREGQDRRANR